MITWRNKNGAPAAGNAADRSRSNDFLEAIMQFGVFAPVLLESWGAEPKRARGRRTS